AYAFSSTCPSHIFFLYLSRHPRHLHSFPTRRSSDLRGAERSRSPVIRTTRSTTLAITPFSTKPTAASSISKAPTRAPSPATPWRSEEHTSELQSRGHLVCRLLLEKKKRSRSA